MSPPNVSIIIPLYNSEDRIAKTLTSIKKQCKTNWECIIVDDGSMDSSKELVITYTKGDKRFKLIERSYFTNIRGANMCRNIGIENSTSELLMFIDSDDTIKHDCLSTRLSQIGINPNFDLYLFKTAFVDAFENVEGSFKIITKENANLIVNFIMHNISWHTMSPIWRKNYIEKIGMWNVDYERLQDVELNVRALLDNPKIWYSRTDHFDSYYYIREKTKDKKIATRRAFCRLVKDYFIRLQRCEILNQCQKQKVTRVLEYYLEEQISNYIHIEKEKDEYLESLVIETLIRLDQEPHVISKIKKSFNNK